MTPTTKEWKEARAQALRVVARKYAAVAHEADLIVDDAIAESLPRFVDGSFAALVTQTASRRALNRLQELAYDKGAYDVLRAEAEETFEATSPDHEPAAHPLERLKEVTIEQTREATLAECRRRLAAAIGGGRPLDDMPSPGTGNVVQESRLARQILKLAQASSSLLQMMNVMQLEAASRRRLSFRYLDPSGTEHTYGSTCVEAAVLAILYGSWPTKTVAGAHPADIIALRANAIEQSLRRQN